MAEGASDVVINVGAKADEAGVKATADKVTRSLELVMRKAQAIGTDAAKALSRQLEAIKGGVASGAIGAKEANILANQFISITKSAKGTSDVIGQYGSAIRVAAANSQRFTAVLDDLAAAERREAQARILAAEAAAEAANKTDFSKESAAMQTRLGKMGTAGAKRASAQLSALQRGFEGGAIGEEDVAAIAKVLRDINERGDEAKNVLKSLGSAFLSTAAQSDKAAEALAKVDVAYSAIKAKGSSAFDALAKNADIDNEVQNIADAVAALAAEAEKARPQSEAFAAEIEKIQKILFSGEAIDAKALKDIERAFKSATAEAQRLHGEVARKLSPSLLSVGRSINQIKATVKTSDLAGAANEVADAIGNIDPAAQRVSSSILGWAKNLKGVGALMAKFPGIFSLVAVAITGVVAAFNKLKSMTLDSLETMERIRIDSFAEGFENEAKRLENQNRLRMRGVELQRQQIENARAIQDAERGMASAELEYSKALEMSGALSDEERARVERKYARRQAEKEHGESIADIGRAREDNAREMENNNARIAELQKAIDADERRRRQANYYADNLSTGGNNFLKGQGIVERLEAWFGEALGEKIDGEKIDEMVKGLRQTTENAKNANREREREIADLMSRNMGLQGKDEVFAKQIEAANLQLKAAEAQDKAAQEVRERERKMQNQDRSWTLEDREWEEERAEREARFSRDEAVGGSRVAKRNAEERLRIAQDELAQDAKELRNAEARELKRLNEGRAPGEQLRSISQADERDLSDEFRRERARYENFIIRDKGNVRSAEQGVWQAKMQGDEKEAELYGQMRGSKNRLTAMGLGGDVSSGKQTATNTRLSAAKLTELVPLVKSLANHRGGQRLESGGGAVWGMD